MFGKNICLMGSVTFSSRLMLHKTHLLARPVTASYEPPAVMDGQVAEGAEIVEVPYYKDSDRVLQEPFV